MTQAVAQAANVEHRRVIIPSPLAWQREINEALASDAVFILAAVGRRAGKTHGASRTAGKTALRLKCEVPWLAPSYQLTDKGTKIFEGLWGPTERSQGILARAISQSPPKVAHLVGGGSVAWYTTQGAYSKAEGGKGVGILGGGYPLVILDEAARIPWPLIEQEILPTIADTGGKILAPTTPRGKANWTYRWYAKAREGNPLYRCVHGPSTMNPNPNIAAFVELMQGEMDDLLFRQEIMAEFLSGTGTVFRNVVECTVPDARWYGSHAERVKAGGPAEATYAIGCDVAKHQDWTVLVALDVERGVAVGYERFNQLSWPLIEDRIALFGERWLGAEIWLDSTGVGDPVYDHLDARGVAVSPTKFTNESKARLVQGLAAAMDRKGLGYPDEPALVGELDSFDYEILPSGRFRYGAPEGYHDDIVIALALAVYGMNRVVTGVPM